MNTKLKFFLIFTAIGISFLFLILNYSNEVYNIKELNSTEKKIFEWKDNYNEYLDQKNVYEKYFNNEKFNFPRQKVYKIKFLEKDKLFHSFWKTKKIKEDKIDEVVFFFNNPENFDWGETTWSDEESNFIFKFYNEKDEVIGLVNVCFEGCYMTSSKPFSPNMKYGGLSKKGADRLFKMIYKFGYYE